MRETDREIQRETDRESYIEVERDREIGGKTVRGRGTGRERE